MVSLTLILYAGPHIFSPNAPIGEALLICRCSRVAGKLFIIFYGKSPSERNTL